MYKVNQIGVVTFGDKTTSRVKIIHIDTYPASGMPNDLVFQYLEEETHRPLVNHVLEQFGHPKGSFNLPEGLADMVFKIDN